MTVVSAGSLVVEPAPIDPASLVVEASVVVGDDVVVDPAAPEPHPTRTSAASPTAALLIVLRGMTDTRTG